MKKLNRNEKREQAAEIRRIMSLVKLSNSQMAAAMGVPYDTLKNWVGKRGRRMSSASWRCLEFVELTREDYGSAAEWLAEWGDVLGIRS